MVRRYLDTTDAKSTGNLREHASSAVQGPAWGRKPSQAEPK